MPEPTAHEIYGVKFGQNLRGVRGHYFLGADGDPHDEQMRLDYYVWVIRSPGQDIVLDVGFTAETNKRRQRDHWENPSQALARLGVDPASVPYVIISHLHYDHCGDVEPFTSARFVLQEEEMAFWTGRFGPRAEFARNIELPDIRRMLELNYEGRVQMVDGLWEVVDGVWVQKVGGHTPGMQATFVRTRKGIVVLASDSSHFFENIEQDKPFAVHTSIVDMYRGFDAMNAAATSGIVIAGHDPLIGERFPAVPGQEGHVVRVA
ncbi:N-acyl homoserine lactonase family protein [Microbacterium elymi]|uniref:N-acyl homoserine lactonase family protein n=1 Tax=Microbacterium elymi TaxID=2909587 RepID=A0ABY5NHJ6_9MICO|nr:N-acyl homoserine lactonase family protein [Microbacterium elymi]UUT34669.1 N-acyl homoserine lactonase family protein [Microbacterium elymi]